MKNFLAVLFLCLFNTVAFAQINVVSTFPANGAFNVNTDSVVITFDTKIKLDENNPEDIEFFILLPFDSLSFNGTNISEDGKTFTFYVDLKPNTDFTGLVMDIEGENGEQMETPHLFRFTTHPTVGEFTVQGHLSSGDPVALKEEVASQKIIIALVPDKKIFEEGMNDQPNIVYANLLSDYDNLTFTIPSVRGGFYYPVAFTINGDDGDGDGAMYVYDLDGNLETPDSILVDLATTSNGIISGIELHQLKADPITFSESFAKNIEISNQLGSNYVLLQVHSWNRFTPNSAEYLLSGKVYEWEYIYLNTANDSTHRVNINSLQAEHRSDYGFFDYLPDGVTPSDLLPISTYTNIIDSDSVLQIAEDNGGTVYRSDFENDPSFRIDINIGLTHEYGLHVVHYTENVPITWVVSYYIMQNDDYFDGFRVYIDPETGDVLPDNQIQGYKVEGNFVGNNIDLQTYDVGVILNRTPPVLTLNGGIENFDGYSVHFNAGSLSYHINGIDEGIYYPIAWIQNNNAPLPTYYIYDLDDDFSTPDSIIVNSETTTYKRLSNIDLKQWKIQPISSSQAISKADSLFDETTFVWKAVATSTSSNENLNNYLVGGVHSNWNLEFYEPSSNMLYSVNTNPFSADLYYSFQVSEGSDEYQPIPENTLSSDSIAVIVENNGARNFRNTYKNKPDYSLTINYSLANKAEMINMIGEVPSSSSDLYWRVVYTVYFTNPETESKEIYYLIDAVTGDILDDNAPEVPTYTVEGKITADNLQALKDEVQSQTIKVALNRIPPILLYGQIQDTVIAYLTELDTETLTYTFYDVDEGTYYPFAWVANETDSLTTYYIYNKDDNFSSTDNIVVNSETTTNKTLSDIDLMQWKTSIPIGILSNNELPDKTSLLQNYPNPFNPTTNIPFTLNKAGFVELSIYNAIGQKVATLIDKNYQAGSHTMLWDATQFSSGIYLYRLTTNGISHTRKLLLIK